MKNKIGIINDEDDMAMTKDGGSFPNPRDYNVFSTMPFEGSGDEYGGGMKRFVNSP